MLDSQAKSHSAAAALPSACKGVDPCNDVACQQAIAQTHLITEQEFQSRIIPGAGAPKVLSAVEMQGIVDSGACNKEGILFNQNVLTNAELNPVAGPYDPAFVVYSIPFFKGILSESPESFGFYLATGGSTGTDVIFRVTFLGKEPDRYYDNSESWPYM
jgi:hypothetical protein